MTFSDPNILGGGWPSPGFAVMQLVLVGQAEKAAAEKKAAEEAEKVPFLPTLDGFGLCRAASEMCSCVEWRHPSHSHMSALCRTPAVRLRVRVRNRGAMWATACAFALL